VSSVCLDGRLIIAEVVVIAGGAAVELDEGAPPARPGAGRDQ
jgi:hypothetical protein